MKTKRVKIINKAPGTFGGEVGSGLGCLAGAVALGILFNFPRILDLIEKYLTK